MLKRSSVGLPVVGFCLLLLFAAIGPRTVAAQPPDAVDITMDFAQLIRFDAVISTIVVGNPAIADASVQDKQTLIVTGRGLGITNMVVFDDKGQEISNFLLRVRPQHEQRVIVRYDSSRFRTFFCAPACSPLVSAPAARN